MAHIGSLVPAYGRDYKSKKEILEDLAKGKDFDLQTFNGGGYVTARELDITYSEGWSAQVRFGNLRKVTSVSSKEVAKVRQAKASQKALGIEVESQKEG